MDDRLTPDECEAFGGHQWEPIWDDGERSCRVCWMCGVERIFEYDPDWVYPDVTPDENILF